MQNIYSSLNLKTCIRKVLVCLTCVDIAFALIHLCVSLYNGLTSEISPHDISQMKGEWLKDGRLGDACFFLHPLTSKEEISFCQERISKDFTHIIVPGNRDV